jgi:hypothetical protein
MASILTAPPVAPWEARRRLRFSHQEGRAMSPRVLPAHVQSQLGGLTAAEKKRLARIADDFLGALELVNEVNVGAAPVGSWSPAVRRLNAALDQMKALVEVPAVLPTITKEGPDGNGIGLHLHPADWRAHVNQRNKLARDAVERLKQALGVRSGNVIPRDKYIYERMKKGDSLKKIMEDVNRRRRWEPLTTTQGVSQAAKRHAEKHGLTWPLR